MTLKKELTNEKVSHLDLSSFCEVGQGTAVRQAVDHMRTSGTNVCLVTDGAKLLGIVTDRDILRKVANQPETWDKAVDEVMTPDPITVKPDLSAAEALWLMDEKHFRNLPAVDEEGTIVGNMTHQAVIDYLASLYPTQILNLPPRPDQFPDQVEGG